MKVCITGSNGFVGRNLINSPTNFVKIPVSLRSDFPINLPECDAIVHLAGKAHDLKKVSNPEEYYKVNFELTKEIYNSFLKSKATKFIFISTVKAVADHLDFPLTEDQQAYPETHYGKSKLMAEGFIQSQPLPEGKSFYILRPCMIHGPGNKGNLNLLYQLVDKGIPYPLAAFENKRSFLSIDNLCFVIKEIIDRNDIPGGTYHLADDESLSTNDLIKLLNQSLNRRPHLWKINRLLIKTLARIGDKFHLPLNSERLDKMTENYVVSNHKIKLALGKQLPLSAAEGILKTARSFKNG